MEEEEGEETEEEEEEDEAEVQVDEPKPRTSLGRRERFDDDSLSRLNDKNSSFGFSSVSGLFWLDLVEGFNVCRRRIN